MNHKPISNLFLIKDTSNLVPTVQDEISQETATRITNDTQLQKVPRRSGS